MGKKRQEELKRLAEENEKGQKDAKKESCTSASDHESAAMPTEFKEESEISPSNVAKKKKKKKKKKSRNASTASDESALAGPQQAGNSGQGELAIPSETANGAAQEESEQKSPKSILQQGLVPGGSPRKKRTESLLAKTCIVCDLFYEQVFRSAYRPVQSFLARRRTQSRLQATTTPPQEKGTSTKTSQKAAQRQANAKVENGIPRTTITTRNHKLS